MEEWRSGGVEEWRSGDNCTVGFVSAHQVMSALLHSYTPTLLKNNKKVKKMH